jgi:hypothetical protein
MPLANQGGEWLVALAPTQELELCLHLSLVALGLARQSLQPASPSGQNVVLGLLHLTPTLLRACTIPCLPQLLLSGALWLNAGGLSLLLAWVSTLLEHLLCLETLHVFGTPLLGLGCR